MKGLVLFLSTFTLCSNAYAFDTFHELKKALTSCQRNELQAILKDPVIIEYRSGGYEGSGCEWTKFSSRIAGQERLFRSYICGSWDPDTVKTIWLWETMPNRPISEDIKLLSYDAVSNTCDN